jgi:hypothetical protein
MAVQMMQAFDDAVRKIRDIGAVRSARKVQFADLAGKVNECLDRFSKFGTEPGNLSGDVLEIRYLDHLFGLRRCSNYKAERSKILFERLGPVVAGEQMRYPIAEAHVDPIGNIYESADATSTLFTLADVNGICFLVLKWLEKAGAALPPD